MTKETTTSKNPFRAKGTFTGISYVERDADSKLMEFIKDNRCYPYMLAPRQSGKSSLIAHTMQKLMLNKETYSYAFVDLSTFPLNPDYSYDQFLEHFSYTLINYLKISDKIKSTNDLEYVMNKLIEYLNKQIIIFVDEIDALLEVHFKDNFLGLIRSFFNLRGTNIQFEKIQFVLAGAILATKLISKPNISPFNVGDPVLLENLSNNEILKLVQYLPDDFEKKTLADHIYKYTKGSVYLTQLILEKLWDSYAKKEIKVINNFAIDKIINKIIQDSPQNLHFKNIYFNIVNNPSLLKAFQTYVETGYINTFDYEKLEIIGITYNNNPYKNLIYESVFGHGGKLSLFISKLILSTDENKDFITKSASLSVPNIFDQKFASSSYFPARNTENFHTALFTQLVNLTETPFNQLLLKINFPSSFIPPKQVPQVERVYTLLEWAISPLGCGLQKIYESLEIILKKPPSNVENRKQELLNDLSDAYRHLGTSLSEVDKLRLYRQIQSLERELFEIEEKINSLTNPLASPFLSITKHNLPHRNRFFTGRVDVLNQLDELIKYNQQVAIKQAISGMGGVGKTQTALEFCHQHINDYQTILWINAENEISFNTSYYNLVDLLNLASSSDGANQGLKVDKVISLVKRWLANNSNWLMVLDNLEDPKLIKDYLPSNHQGHILITTQQHDLGTIANTITLDKMDSNTGSSFLLKRIGLLSENDSLEKANINDLSVAQKIVQAMDGLPLGLQQAGVYIQENGCSLSDYLKAYQDVRNSVRILDNDGEDPNDHKSVYATFKLNFDVVKEKSVAAAKLLEVCSFLDNELIPEEIFTSAGNFLGDELAKLQDNNYEFNNCLKILLNYSLIERDTNNKYLSIHRLVQVVVRELISEEDKKSLIDSLAKALHSLSNNDARDPKTWLTYQKLLPSITSLFDFAKLYQSNIIEVANLFHQFGLYCDTQALFTQSLTFYNLATDIYKYHFGDNHPSVANILNDISEVYHQIGNYSLALEFYNQSLTIGKHIYGDKHPNVFNTLNNIASVYREQGKYSDALDLYYQALTIYKHHFGDFHPSVAQTLNNIAIVYRQQGKYSDALDFYNQALTIRKHHFGDFHPSVAQTLNNIGLVHQAQGNYPFALDFFSQSLDITKHHFGDNHPDVAGTLNNIGGVYQVQGNYPKALDFYNQSLTIRKHHFSDNHPDVADSLNNIGLIYDSQGNYPQALDFYNQSLSIKKHHFGDNHPSVADSLNNIAIIYRQQGNYPLALDFYNQSLSIKKHHFGDNHPSVALSLWGIASVYKASNKELEAANYYKHTLEILNKFLPPTHPWIAQLLNQYSQLLIDLNKPDEAQPLLDRLASLQQSP